jgi:hypothetical protein
MSKKLNHFLKIISLIIISLFTSYIISLAWTEPTSTPPYGNISAPINVSNQGQIKYGGLLLNLGGATTGLIVATGNVGIGTTAPEAKLDVKGNMKVGDYIYLEEPIIEGDFIFVCSYRAEWTNKNYCAWRYRDPDGVTYYYDYDNNGYPPPCGEPVKYPISLPSVNTMQTIINGMGVSKLGAFASKNHVIEVISMTQPRGVNFCGGGGTDATTATVKIRYKQPYIMIK